MNYKSIFFDLYGTLFIFGDMNAAWNDWADSYYKLVIDCGGDISENKFKTSLNGFFSKPRPIVSNNELTLYEHRMANHCELLNLSFSSEQLQAISTVTINAWQNHILLDNEAIPVLKKLKLNYTLALVSNFDHPPHIYSLLAGLELSSLFNEIIISGEVGADKPDPKIFQIALERTNQRPGEVLFVGDSVEDMEGAKAAGLKPVYIKRQREEDDHVIVDFHSDSDDPDRIQKQPDNEGVIIISNLSELLEITKKEL